MQNNKPTILDFIIFIIVLDLAIVGFYNTYSLYPEEMWWAAASLTLGCFSTWLAWELGRILLVPNINKNEAKNKPL